MTSTGLTNDSEPITISLNSFRKPPDKKPSLAVEHGQNIAELERVPAIKRADRSEKEQGCHFLILVDSDWSLSLK